MTDLHVIDEQDALETKDQNLTTTARLAATQEHIEHPETSADAVDDVASAAEYSLLTEPPTQCGASREDTAERHTLSSVREQPEQAVAGGSALAARSVTSLSTAYQDAVERNESLPDSVDLLGSEDGRGNHMMFEHLAEEQHLEAEDDDNDSAIGSDTESTTTTLSASIFNYRKEHGRTYHAYKDGRYIFPNDEREADRLDLQHHLFYLTFAGRLHFAPIAQPSHALDVGTGTGIWAVDFADQYPQCQVVGIDLSPGQPTMIPPNLKFVIDDAEDMWLYQNKFDYIHGRLMAGCFSDWPNFFRQAFDNLEPGGWLELQVKSADGTTQGTNIERWGTLLCQAARKLGRPMGSDACNLYEDQMRAAGFVDVHRRMFMWPSNGWPKDPYMKELGRWNVVNCLDGLEGFCLALLTRALGWKREEVDIFVAQVTKDFKNKSIHAYFPMPVTLGRKPRVGETV